MYNIQMEAEIISADSFISAFDDCMRRVEKRKIDLGKRTVVIVPDKYTLYAERRLFLGGGAFDVEVVTFSRLLSKCGVRPRGYISRFGAVMLLRKLIGDGEELKCFDKSARFIGFADKIYDTIAQLNASGVTPEILSETDASDAALKAKTDDLRLLQQKYNDATKDKYTDSSELLRLLPEAVLNCDYLDSAVVYVLNFDRLTARHRAAIKAVEQKAEKVYVYDAAQKSDAKLKRNKRITVYSAPDFETELKSAAARICAGVYENNLKYSDFCIAVSNIDYNIVSRVLSQYGVPFSLDRKYPLKNHPKARFVMCALAAADGRLSRAKLIALSKNFLTGITASQSAAFENYCNRRRVDYKGFLSEFEDEPAESARKKLTEIILPLSERLHTYMTATEFVDAVKSLAEKAEKLDALPTADEAVDLVAAGDKLDEIIDLMDEIMGQGTFPLQLLIATLKEGIDSREISVLPALADSVTIGQPALFRGQKFAKVFVLGFNEGSLPIVTQDCGIVTDAEIDRLERAGTLIEPKTEEVNERARSELLHLIDGCDDCFLSYAASDGSSGQAALLTLIARENAERCDISFASYERERDALYYGENPLLLERLACCKGAAKELFASGLNRPFRPPYMSELARVLKEEADGLLKQTDDDFVLEKPYDIFFRKGTAYISQLQTFFLCPYRHFLEYGLGLKEREDGTVTPKDVGIILHKVAEVFAGESRFDTPGDRAVGIFDRLLKNEMKDFADLPQNKLNRLKNESKRLCETIAAQLTRSDYETVGQEAMFSSKKGAAFEAPEITLKSGAKIAVVGVMDRVDACGKTARVIDYKTGYIGGALKAEKLYYGTKFQLQFYCSVLRDNGYDIGGMFYFPVGGDWADGSEYCRMTGIFDSDTDGIVAMDNALKDGGVSELFNATLKVDKKGELTLSRNGSAFPKEQLAAICDYAEKIFYSGIDDIDDGFIMPLPHTESGRLACEFCPYAVVCLNHDVAPRACGGDCKSAVTKTEDGGNGV